MEEWYSRFGVKFDLPAGERSRIVNDAALAGWAQMMGNLTRDMAVVSCGTYKAPHALDITKLYDSVRHLSSDDSLTRRPPEPAVLPNDVSHPWRFLHAGVRKDGPSYGNPWSLRDRRRFLAGETTFEAQLQRALPPTLGLPQ